MPRSGLCPPGVLLPAIAGFNEAGAIMPRSGHSVGGGNTRRARSFNEAGAIMPRSGVGTVRDGGGIVVVLQ